MESIVNRMPKPYGRPPKYATAKKLWAKFLDYIQWADANPIQGYNRQAASGDKQTPKSKSMAQMLAPRPYTLVGFITFAGISNWSEFNQENRTRKKISL